MRQERFTEQAQEVLAVSQELVRRYRHSQWDVEHVLLALLQQEGGLTAEILNELKVDADAVKQQIETVLDLNASKCQELCYMIYSKNILNFNKIILNYD